MQALTHIYLGAFVWPANFIQNANMLVKKVLITRYILQYLECIRLKEEELGWDSISLFLKTEKKWERMALQLNDVRMINEAWIAWMDWCADIEIEFPSLIKFNARPYGFRVVNLAKILLTTTKQA